MRPPGSSIARGIPRSPETDHRFGSALANPGGRGPPAGFYSPDAEIRRRFCSREETVAFVDLLFTCARDIRYGADARRHLLEYSAGKPVDRVQHYSVVEFRFVTDSPALPLDSVALDALPTDALPIAALPADSSPPAALLPPDSSDTT